MTKRAMIEAEITFLPKSEGGRSFPDGIFQNLQYRPHIVIGDPMQRKSIVVDGNRLTELYLGIAFTDGPQKVELGLPMKATMLLAYWPSVDYETVVPDATFTLREGVRIIGYGKVLRRWVE
jgi:hypothetical protein